MKLRCLYVEDDDFKFSTVCRTMRLLGFDDEVTRAGTWDEFIHEMSGGPFDYVITDWNFPRREGSSGRSAGFLVINFCDKAAVPVPVFVISGTNREDAPEHSLDGVPLRHRWVSYGRLHAELPDALKAVRGG